SELTYQLIEQVSGRSGRSELAGEVVIQTYNPDHYAIINANEHNYSEFYKREIKTRKIMKNPPFVDRIELMVSSDKKLNSYTVINEIKKVLSNNSSDEIIILGPSEASIFKIDNKYRYVITIKFTNEISNDIIEKVFNQYANRKDISLSIQRM
ncbi:MAG: primosomal protein N', partial [Anaeroplasmataceae bacterium]